MVTSPSYPIPPNTSSLRGVLGVLVQIKLGTTFPLLSLIFSIIQTCKTSFYEGESELCSQGEGLGEGLGEIVGSEGRFLQGGEGEG